MSGPECFWEDIPSPAGTELGIYGTAEGLAGLGHLVDVYLPRIDPRRYRGVRYLAPESFPHREYDVVVSVHYAHPFEKRHARLQVVLGPSQDLVGIERAPHVDRCMTYSRYVRDKLLARHPAYVDKMWVTRNGEWLERYHTPLERRRDYHRLVWASSPDRGLHHLVRILPRVRGHLPDVTLTVAYDFDHFIKTTTHLPTLKLLHAALPLKELSGVEFVGHLSQPRLAELLRTSGLLVYPNDVPENYGGIVNNALAAGLPALASDIGGIPELYAPAVIPLAHPVDEEEWADSILVLLEEEDIYFAHQRAGWDIAAGTDYSEVASEWEAFFTEYFATDGHETVKDRGLASRFGR